MESIWKSYPLMYVQSLAKISIYTQMYERVHSPQLTHKHKHKHDKSGANVRRSRELPRSPTVTKYTDTFLIC